MKWNAGILLNKLSGKGKGKVDRDALIFLFFLLLAFIFWYLNALGKEVEDSIRYPVEYVNFPEGTIPSGDLPSFLDLYVKGPGYSLIKLKISGSRAPAILDLSTISYRRIRHGKAVNYYILTSGLIPNLRNQLRAECDIVSIKPDTLMLHLDRVTSKKVPVIPHVEVITEKQYLVKGKIISRPDSVVITGPKQIVDTVTGVRTMFKKIRGLDETLSRKMLLVTSGSYAISEKKVDVTIPVEEFTEAEFRVPVSVLNNSDSLFFRIFPDAVTVKCLVAVSDYKKIGENPIELFVDSKKADLSSTEKLQVEIGNIPLFINSVRIIPSKVDFLIEKKAK